MEFANLNWLTIVQRLNIKIFCYASIKKQDVLNIITIGLPLREYKFYIAIGLSRYWCLVTLLGGQIMLFCLPHDDAMCYVFYRFIVWKVISLGLDENLL